MNSKRRHTYALIWTLACANTALYGLPFMKSQFYDVMMSVLHLNHMQLSMLFSINGAICLFAYAFGGIITDYFSTKKIMILALVVSGALHFYVITVPSYIILCFIYAAFAATSVLVFYPASMKALSLLGENKENGKIFGSYIAAIDIIGLAVVGVGLATMMLSNSNVLVFRVIVGLYAILHFTAAYFLYKLYDNEDIKSKSERIVFKEIVKIIKDPKLWGVTVMIFCNYLMLAATTYIIPFLSDVYEMNETAILVISIFRVNIIAIILAPMAGRIVDKIHSATKLMLWTFAISIGLSILMMASITFKISSIALICIILLISAAIVSAKSLNLVTLSEINIPRSYMGTAIGLVSFIGYSPDAFFYTVAGWAIDKYQTGGYRLIFFSMLFCAILGTMASLFVLQVKSKEKGQII